MSLDEKIREILAPFDLQTAKNDRMLTCSKCLSDTTYTVRGLCGPCYLFGDLARPSDFRTPKISSTSAPQ